MTHQNPHQAHVVPDGACGECVQDARRKDNIRLALGLFCLVLGFAVAVVVVLTMVPS